MRGYQHLMVNKIVNIANLSTIICIAKTLKLSKDQLIISIMALKVVKAPQKSNIHRFHSKIGNLAAILINQ